MLSEWFPMLLEMFWRLSPARVLSVAANIYRKIDIEATMDPVDVSRRSLPMTRLGTMWTGVASSSCP